MPVSQKMMICFFDLDGPTMEELNKKTNGERRKMKINEDDFFFGFFGFRDRKSVV